MNKNGKKITYILLYINYWRYCATFLFYTVDIGKVVFFGTISQITAVLITAVEQTYRFVALREFNTVEENNNPLIIIRLICVPYKSETSEGLYYCYAHVITRDRRKSKSGRYGTRNFPRLNFTLMHDTIL